MYINLQTLIKLPVYTESGEKVGFVKDLEIDISAHSVRHYIVAQGLIGKNYFWVSPVQIVSISAKQIIVKDAILTDPAFKENKSVRSKPALGGAISS